METIRKVLLASVFGCSFAIVTADDSHPRDHNRHHGNGHGMHRHWAAPPGATRTPNPIAADSASVKRGGEIYAKYCAVCHGAAGRGDGPAAKGLSPPPPDLKVMAPHHPDGDLAWKIAEGRGPMPAWKDVLTKNQIWDAVNYLKKGLGSTKSEN